jgi:hypothetical protein
MPGPPPEYGMRKMPIDDYDRYESRSRAPSSRSASKLRHAPHHDDDYEEESGRGYRR